MRRLLAALALALPSAAAAAPSLESAAAGTLAAFETTALPRPSPRMLAIARQPAVATMEGGFAGFPFGLTLDRRAWTINGAIGGTSFGVKIDHDAKTITGGLNGSPVELSFDWTPEKVSYSGTVNQGPVDYTVDWQAGVVEGHANGLPLHLEFNLQTGVIDGDKSFVNGMPMGLTLDAVTGKATGAINGQSFGMTIVNADLSEVVQYLFVFLKR
ncbi:MAG: hypothetical protein ACHQ51_02870 [Elusimicrobiota bacterium]